MNFPTEPDVLKSIDIPNEVPKQNVLSVFDQMTQKNLLLNQKDNKIIDVKSNL